MSVFSVHVTVDPVKVTPFNLVTTVAPVLSGVAVSDEVAVVMFAEYSVTSGSNVGDKVAEPSVSALRFCVKKPLWCPNQLNLP